MKEFFKKNKKRIIVFLIFISILSVFWILSQTKKVPKTTPTPIGAPLQFKLLRTNPAYGVGAQIINTNAIDFKFSKPIDVSTLVVNISPEIEFSFETDEENRVLYIIPNPNWTTDQLYKFLISVNSKDGDKLPEKIEYQLQIKPITTSELTEQFFTPEPSNTPEATPVP